MTLDELMEAIEIENLDEFEFFEHFSALMECPDEIEFDMFAKILAEVDASLLYELTDNYFEDIMLGVPDDAMGLYSMLYTIRSSLCDAAKESNSRQDRIFYIEELYRFRNWYLFDSVVKCRRLSDGLETEETLFDALALYRLEKLGEDKYDYDFTHALEYSVEDYASASENREYDSVIDTEPDDDDFDETLIDRDNPVIDSNEPDDEDDWDENH